MIRINRSLSILLALACCLILFINFSTSDPLDGVRFDEDGDVIMEDAFENNANSEGSAGSGLDLNLGL